MEPTTVAILAVAAANAVVVLGSVALWFGHRARRTQRLERLCESLESRLAELTRAVDVVAVEVERVAESQRYLALQGQPPSRPTDVPPPTPGRRIVTPH